MRNRYGQVRQQTRRRLRLEILERRLMLAADLDDELSEATFLGAASTTAASYDQLIIPDTDVDMYRFTATSNQVVDIDIDTAINGLGGVDAYVRLFNSRGQQIASSDNAFAPGEDDLGFDPYLRHTFDSAGTYYIGVSNANNISYNPTDGRGDVAGGPNATGTYTIVLQALPVDPDDSLAEASSLGAVSPTAITVDASITPDVDVDMYRFRVENGQVVDFDIDTTTNGPGGLGSYLRLFDSRGEELAFNNDGMAPGENLLGFDAFLRHAFVSSGTYYLGVSNVNNTQYNPDTGNEDTAGGLHAIGDYQLIIRTAPIVPNDPDDEISEATALGGISTTPETVAAVISPGVDVDMYEFSVTDNLIVDFDIDTPINGLGGLGSYLRLFNDQGEELAWNDDATAPGETKLGFDAYLRYPFSESGTYYLAVSNANNIAYDPITGDDDVAAGQHSTGEYTLTLRALPDDPDDTLTEAISLGTITTNPDTAADEIVTDIDVDMYRFTVTSGQVVDFDIDTAENGPDGLGSFIRLFDSQGQQLAANNDGAAPGELIVGFDAYLRYEFSNSGTYYLGVSSWNNTTYNASTGAGDSPAGPYSVGSYQLIVQTAPEDPVDGDDEISEAINLNTISTSPVEVDAAITPGADVDMYRFRVSGGDVVDFDIDTPLNGPGGLGSYLRLFTLQGTELASNNDGAAPGENDVGFDSYLRYTFASSGTYYLGVSNWNNIDYDPLDGTGDTSGGNGAVGSYRLILQALPDDLDDSLREATVLQPLSTTPQTLEDAIATDIDVDLYRFTADAGQLVGFDIDTPLNGPGGLGSYLRLFDDRGEQLAANDDGADLDEIELGIDSYLQYTFAVDGTYYLGVSNANNIQFDPLTGEGDTAGGDDSIGSYTLTLREIPLGDPTLELSISPATIRENGGTTTATLTRSGGDNSEPLVVNLTSDDESEASVPATVTIPANSSSTTFSIVGVDDARLDGTQTVTITASTAGYENASDSVAVTDHETLTLTIDPTSIDENGTAIGTVVRSNTDDQTPLIVVLESDDPGEATVPASVVIPATSGGAAFTILGVDDGIVDQTQRVLVTASAPGFVGSSAQLDVIGDEPTLVLTLTDDLLWENGGTIGATVSRTSEDLSMPLVVTLTSSDVTEAVVPQTVTIEANDSSANFTITGVDDAEEDGLQRTTITAEAPGFAAVARVVLVADDETSYQNPRDALDVNGDTFVSPIDVLLLIHILNDFGNGPAAVIMDQYEGPALFPDTSGDNFISPVDALRVIAFLNNETPAEGEGENPGRLNLPGAAEPAGDTLSHPRAEIQRSVARRSGGEQMVPDLPTGLPVEDASPARMWAEDTDWRETELDEVLQELSGELTINVQQADR